MKITNTEGRMRANDVLEFIENVGTGFWKEYKKEKKTSI
jgi:hypothetical protein